jgi:KaiC/GvpD/RAD55 family RecA-like ATPase
MNKMRKHFGDPVVMEGREREDDFYITHAILQDATDYYHSCLGDNQEALKYLEKERGLTFETIVEHKLGWADGGLRKHLIDLGHKMKDISSTGLIDRHGNDFLDNVITIPYISQGNTVSIRGKQIGGKYLTPPGNPARLYNTDAVWVDKPDNLVITEGEFDALILKQLGFHAIASPGANVWQEAWVGYAASVKRVFICFDPDEAGRAGSEKVARALGPKARIARLPDAEPGQKPGENDISFYVTERGWSKADFDLLFVKSRGGHLLTVDDCYEEWQAVQNTVGLKFGVEYLDNVISPGLLPAQVCIVLAKSGVGKTIFLLNMFERMLMAQPDLNILFVSLEQTRGEWFERAHRIHRFYNLDATYADCLDFYRNRLQLVDKNRVTKEELISCIEQYEIEVGKKPDIVAIDYLGYWARSFKGERYERTSEAIMELKEIAKDTRITFLAPHQVGRTTGYGDEPDADSARDSGVIEETSDFLFTLWSSDNQKGKGQEDHTGEVNLRIGKSRHGGKGTLVKFQFAPFSLALAPSSEDIAQLARNELLFKGRGDNYKQVVYRHRSGEMDLVVPEAELV